MSWFRNGFVHHIYGVVPLWNFPLNLVSNRSAWTELSFADRTTVIAAKEMSIQL